MIKRTEIATGDYREMSYDFRNRLVMVSERDSANVATQVSTYTYDCFDKRISKQVDTAPGDNVEAPKQWFAYDGANVRLEFVDTDGSGAQPALMTTRYFNGAGIDNIVAQENYAGSEFTSGAFWHLKDRLGSTTDLEGSTLGEGSNQQQSNSIEYDSFGTVLSQSNASVGSRYMYTGREFDSETGEQYNRARYYDSGSGRFISEDPIGFAAGPNQYGYVGGNPIMKADPSGLVEWSESASNIELNYFINIYNKGESSPVYYPEVRLLKPVGANQLTIGGHPLYGKGVGISRAYLQIPSSFKGDLTVSIDQIQSDISNILQKREIEGNEQPDFLYFHVCYSGTTALPGRISKTFGIPSIAPSGIVGGGDSNHPIPFSQYKKDRFYVFDSSGEKVKDEFSSYEDAVEFVIEKYKK